VDVDFIASWEKMGIPLRVVLEGIREAYERVRQRPGSKGKVYSLSYCSFHVLRAFEEYKERKTGTQRKMINREKKRKKIQEEVRVFLDTAPAELSFLREPFGRALRLLSRREVDEKRLGILEEEIEELLFNFSSAQERKKVEEQIHREFPDFRKTQDRSLVQIKLLKRQRERYKIPYLSFYYY
jgi:hypothetical protein